MSKNSIISIILVFVLLVTCGCGSRKIVNNNVNTVNENNDTYLDLYREYAYDDLFNSKEIMGIENFNGIIIDVDDFKEPIFIAHYNDIIDGDSIKISNRTIFEVIYKDYSNEISLYRYLRDIKSASDNYKTIIIKYDTRAEKFYCNYKIQKDNAFTEIGYNFEQGDLYSNIKKMKLVGNQLNLKEDDLRKEVALNISQIEKEFNFFKSINWNSLCGKED